MMLSFAELMKGASVGRVFQRVPFFVMVQEVASVMFHEIVFVSPLTTRLGVAVNEDITGVMTVMATVSDPLAAPPEPAHVII